MRSGLRLKLQITIWPLGICIICSCTVYTYEHAFFFLMEEGVKGLYWKEETLHSE